MVGLDAPAYVGAVVAVVKSVTIGERNEWKRGVVDGHEASWTLTER